MNIAGVILAGGQSRRMGGVEKSLLQVGQKTSIEWIAQRLSPQVQQLAINAKGDPTRFDFTGLPVLNDTVEGFVGPLAGVLTAMCWAEKQVGITHVATAATDSPFMPQNTVSRLAETISAKNDIAMASSNGRIHPVFGLWPIHMADDLEGFLVNEDKRKILQFAERYRLHEVVFDIEDHDPFFNINTPRDLSVAEKIAGNLDL